MKLAIVCSWLNQYGGAERVLEIVHEMYPDAPIYTSIYRPETLPDAYRDWDIRTTWLDELPILRRKHQFLLPLFPMAFESLDLRGYDVVFSLTSAFGHGVLTSAETQHVCYCLTPARFLWSYHGYIEREGIGKLARLGLTPFLRGLRQWDLNAANRVDEFVAISRTVERRIAKHYRRESSLIYPPVTTDLTTAFEPAEDCYLIVSRLVPYKRVDLAVRAFTELGLPLRIIGDGRDRAALEAMAGPTVEFLGFIEDDTEVRRQMARCKALVFPGEEDFGITPLEAMAAGRPVIAYGAGGALDTIIEGETGAFFREATPESLMATVRTFDADAYDPAHLRSHAERFGAERFREELATTLGAAEQRALVR